jgi:hypothetical protein
MKVVPLSPRFLVRWVFQDLALGLSAIGGAGE